jgi:putative transposase
VVGVDLGLRSLATLSTGESVANGRPLAAALRKLRRLNRRLDRQRRANNPANYNPDGTPKPRRVEWRRSKRMLRTEQRLARLHERAANLRREQAHLLTTHLARRYEAIGAESLRVKNMQRDRRLARHIADVGWGQILRQLQYKTAWAGSLLVQADAFYPSSKTCSRCGRVRAKLSRSDRLFACRACGHQADRDLNAALNLAQLAYRRAQVEGIPNIYLARTGRVTRAATGRAQDARSTASSMEATGQISSAPRSRHSPKREDSRQREPSRLREEPAHHLATATQ